MRQGDFPQVNFNALSFGEVTGDDNRRNSGNDDISDLRSTERSPHSILMELSPRELSGDSYYESDHSIDIRVELLSTKQNC